MKPKNPVVPAMVRTTRNSVHEDKRKKREALQRCLDELIDVNLVQAEPLDEAPFLEREDDE